MPRGKHLTDEQRREIYEARMLGESRRDIAEAYGISMSHVTKLVREQRKMEEDMAHRECIVAGDKRNGRLTSTSDPHRYEGTCIVNGKANSKTFTAANAAAAAELWREWCDGLRPKATEAKPVEKPVAKPVEVKPVETKPVEKQEDKPMGGSVYVIWTKGDEPRLFGAYSDMETALKEVDHLNEVASFLVSDRVFEVEELALKA